MISPYMRIAGKYIDIKTVYVLSEEKTALAKLHLRSFRVCQDRALRGAKFAWMQMRPADRQKCSDNPYDNM